MKILYIFFIFCMKNCHSLVTSPNSRIINGSDTYPHEYPFQILITSTIVPTPVFMCTGSLIHPEWILTNDNCVYFDESAIHAYPLQAIAGSYGLDFPEQSRQTRVFYRNETYLYLHPEYQPPHKNDMILVRIFPPFLLDEFVQTIEIPQDPHYIPVGNGIISGWGILDVNDGIFSPVLAEAEVPIQTQGDCGIFYDDQPPSVEKPDFEWNLCAGDPSSDVGLCNGDPGAPLTFFDAEKNVTYLVGVGSGQKYVDPPIPVLPPPSCTRFNRPDFYTRVSKYSPWIIDTILNS